MIPYRVTGRQLWRLPHRPADLTIIDLSPAKGRVGHAKSGPGYRFHRREVGPEEVTEVLGLPVTTPLRTVLDNARMRDSDWAVVVADAALRSGLVDASSLITAADSMRGAWGWGGHGPWLVCAVHVRRVRASRCSGCERSGSGWQSRNKWFSTTLSASHGSTSSSPARVWSSSSTVSRSTGRRRPGARPLAGEAASRPDRRGRVRDSASHVGGALGRVGTSQTGLRRGASRRAAGTASPPLIRSPTQPFAPRTYVC